MPWAGMPDKPKAGSAGNLAVGSVEAIEGRLRAGRNSLAGSLQRLLRDAERDSRAWDSPVLQPLIESLQAARNALVAPLPDAPWIRGEHRRVLGLLSSETSVGRRAQQELNREMMRELAAEAAAEAAAERQAAEREQVAA